MLETARSAIRRAAAAYLNRKIESGTLQMLFIIGHMRSGSSLLVHILNSNPEIIGYGETHHHYHDKSDFGKAAYKIYRLFGTIPWRETYVLDKILHSSHIKNIKLLKKSKTIFLLRDPSQALPSLYKLDPQEYTPDVAAEHYNDRIKYILDTARQLDADNWIFTTYDRLVNQHADTFQQIENFLALKRGLSTKYNKIWATGKKGIGDSSARIQMGTILKDKKNNDIPEDLEPFLGKAHQRYQNCLDELEQMQNI